VAVGAGVGVVAGPAHAAIRMIAPLIAMIRTDLTARTSSWRREDTRSVSRIG
jgi:hypothetical protein